MNIEDICDANKLIEAYQEAQKGSNWKESVQRYGMNLLINTLHSQKALREGTYEQKAFYEFKIHERGKIRDIKSMYITDRVVQRSLCDNILTPAIKPHLIYDNGASMKGKGIDFTRKRLECHLRRYFLETGSNEGYVLLIDFSKYFDNINQKKLYEMICRYVPDPDVQKLIRNILNGFKVDVSYMTDEEYANCMNVVFNSLDYAKINKDLQTGNKYMEKSVGIGSQISQNSGIFYPTEIDTFCKVVKGLHYYGRYMDDTYIIHENKQYLHELLSCIDAICGRLGIFINHKKTQVVKLSHGFTFLKIRYILTDSGRIMKRLDHDTFIREKRKIKKFRHNYDEKIMPLDDIVNAYLGWRGSVKKYKANKESLQSTDQLFRKVFPEYKGQL